MRHLLIEVMSRSQAQKLSEQTNPSTAIISISDYNTEKCNIVCTEDNNIKDVLFLNFDDIDFNHYYAIQETDAFRIAEFVNRWKNDVRKLVVHCGAGISRSAGVAAAIMKHLYGYDWAIFDNPKYNPNMRCYRLTLNALEDFKGENK